TKPEARIAFSELAIKTLSDDSPNISLRYIQHCAKLLHIGDMQGATAALDQAQKHGMNITHPSVVSATGSLFLNLGNFKAAMDCLGGLVNSNPNLDSLAIINNVGLCLEHLGKLKKAKRLFEESERLSVRTGHIAIRIVSLSNIGCVATKLGDLAAAQKHYSGALGRIDDLRATRQE